MKMQPISSEHIIPLGANPPNLNDLKNGALLDEVEQNIGFVSGERINYSDQIIDLQDTGK